MDKTCIGYGTSQLRSSSVFIMIIHFCRGGHEYVKIFTFLQGKIHVVHVPLNLLYRACVVLQQYMRPASVLPCGTLQMNRAVCVFKCSLIKYKTPNLSCFGLCFL